MGQQVLVKKSTLNDLNELLRHLFPLILIPDIPPGVWSRPCRVPQCRRDKCLVKLLCNIFNVLLPCWPTTGKLKNNENKING